MKWCNFFNKISLILQALGCAVLYFVIEAICRHSFTEAWTYMTTKPLVFAYNAAFISSEREFSGVSLWAAYGCFWES